MPLTNLIKKVCLKEHTNIVEQARARQWKGSELKKVCWSWKCLDKLRFNFYNCNLFVLYVPLSLTHSLVHSCAVLFKAFVDLMNRSFLEEENLFWNGLNLINLQHAICLTCLLIPISILIPFARLLSSLSFFSTISQFPIKGVSRMRWEWNNKKKRNETWKLSSFILASNLGWSWVKLIWFCCWHLAARNSFYLRSRKKAANEYDSSTINTWELHQIEIDEEDGVFVARNSLCTWVKSFSEI